VRVLTLLIIASALLFGLSGPWSTRAWAAPCCGGGSAAPTILTGDDHAQLSASLSQAQVIGDAPTQGTAVFRADGDLEQTQTLKVEGAYLFSDRWQFGATLPVVRRSRSTPATQSTSTGFGDLNLNLAYEWLPEWEYSVWKPRGFVFYQELIPTGGSIYESSFNSIDPWGLNARGRGFFASGIGAVFLKSWGGWDAAFVGEGHRSFSRTFSTFDGSLELSPGWGGSLALAGGFSPSSLPLRFGLSLSPAFEEGVRARSASLDSTSDPQLVWTTSVLLGWLVGHESTVSAIYSDQTLLGPASNASLSRTVSISFQRRWQR
jgi:hypothetical protein